MGTWRKVCTGVSVIILILILGLNLFGSPIASWHLEQQVREHLISTDMAEEDILSAKTVYQRDKQTSYMVQIVFTAEPEIVHYYYSNVDNQIQEMEFVGQ